MDMEVEVLIIGAGILGLTSAAELARRGKNVLVVERHPGPGRETSSRNSEVIHAGLYYPEGSLKAVCCVEGRSTLYARCRALGIPYRQLGKWVVACEPADLATLEKLWRRARENGAGACELRDAADVRRAEPRVRALAGLWSPETGIVDAHALMSSYEAELAAHDGTLVFHTRIAALEHTPAGWRVETLSAQGERFSVRAHRVVNAAGLEADRVAALAGLDVDALGYRQHPCKGDYFAVAPRLGPLTQHLVYPVPVPGGLGIHVTLDLGGRFRLGPDVEYVPEPHYAIDASKAEKFASAVRRYLPELETADLTPDFAGVRPKLQGPGEAFRDFVVEEGSRHGAPGLVNLLGIESPGLTASSALARRVAALLD